MPSNTHPLRAASNVIRNGRESWPEGAAERPLSSHKDSSFGNGVHRVRHAPSLVALITAVLFCLGMVACTAAQTPEGTANGAPGVVEEEEGTGVPGGHDLPSDRAQQDGHHHGHMDRRFTSPEDYAARWNDPERDAWQQPERILEAMAIEPGMTVVDLGAGTGYFIPHLAAAVGESGSVLAVDIEEGMIEFTLRLAAEQGLDQVSGVLADLDNPNLEEQSVDRIVTINTWHHIANRAEYSVHLREALREGGAVFVVDYCPEAESHEGPHAGHRIPRATVEAELQAAGFETETLPVGLERQYVVVGRLP